MAMNLNAGSVQLLAKQGHPDVSGLEGTDVTVLVSLAHRVLFRPGHAWFRTL